MKRVLFVAAALLLAGAGLAQAPAAPASGPAGEVLGSYNRLKPNVLKAADKMPEADYQFKPTPEIRTYARIVNHITEAQQHMCSALTGATFDPKSVPSDTADKATIIAGLKASFDLCDKAYGALTNDNISELVTVGQGKRSRIGMAWGNVSHDNEQYAELSTYLRLKGIVPPTAEK
jgi:DinB superfamily